MMPWLMKSEPDVFSIDDLRRKRRETWDGVRNYQARNYLRSMQLGDDVAFYHSSCAVPAIVGYARISRTAFPDPSQFDPHSAYHDPGSKPEDPRWSAVEVEYVRTLAHPLTLEVLKSLPALAQFPLVRKGNRLSVMPVSADEWQCILSAEPKDL
ncbi:MAG: EVE domain-containing protein [Lysobacterales bacterium]